MNQQNIVYSQFIFPEKVNKPSEIIAFWTLTTFSK